MHESRHRAAVTPSPRAAASGWVLEAIFPNGRQATIAGFGTESEANEWLGSARHVAWLRDSRTVFSVQAVVATFEYLSSYVAIVTAAASGFLQSARQAWSNIRDTRGEYRTRSETFALLLAFARAWVVILAQRARKWRSAGRLESVYWRSIVYRCVFAVTATLLIVTAVVAILAAAVAPFGRNEQPAGFGATQTSGTTPSVPARSTEITEVSDPIALLLDRVSSSDVASGRPIVAAAQDLAPQPTGDDGATIEIPAVTPRHDFQRTAPLGIVGVWAPQTGSCSARNAREGLLPAIISERGARAGETSCVFKNQRRIKGNWRLRANCTNGREHWSSNVRLAIKGDRLIWTSERGTQAYIRCRSNV